MSQSIGTFDFKKLSVIFGVSQITGFSEGDAVEIAEENDAFNSVGGADGYVDRVKNNSNFLTITLRLRQTSPTNQVLSGLHNADRLASTPLPILIKDRSGNTLISATAAWIIKHPTTSFGNEAKEREWMIKTGSTYVVNLGGNN
tara:strand:- start:16 stop:447 length:432 start_codon:yes stop_codon:yes gene_type:complete